MRKMIKLAVTSLIIVAVIAIGSSLGVMATEPTEPPAKVTGLAAAANTTSMAIDVTWSSPSNATSIDGYTLRYAGGGGETTVSVSSTATSWQHVNPTSGVDYTYEIRASNAAGNGAWSDGATAMLIRPMDTVPSQVQTPSASATATAITLSWNDTHDGGAVITGYTVYYVREGASAITETVTTTSWTGTGLESDPYKFKVRATNAVGDGPWSDEVMAQLVNPSATVPEKVTDITAETDEGTIVLSWAAPDDGGQFITGYTIEYNDDAKKTFTASVSGTTWTHTDPSQTGFEHEYRVRAINAIGNGPWSDALLYRLGD